MAKKHNPFRGRPPADEPEMDTTPVEMPIGFTRPTPLQDLIAKMVRQAVSEETQEEFESMEESDDFDMPDENMLDMSPYEFDELTEEEPLPEPEPAPQPPSEAPQETLDPEPSEPPAEGVDEP